MLSAFLPLVDAGARRFVSLFSAAGSGNPSFLDMPVVSELPQRIAYRGRATPAVMNGRESA